MAKQSWADLMSSDGEDSPNLSPLLMKTPGGGTKEAILEGKVLSEEACEGDG
eukprot:CAMPEP_0172033108 /NCGR_PEP_ID=MMETSP1041-20130122/20254_1 /TAXON_ID=464988 /ORGANISM="Hemiselmis andersenii, Strain CCMP439" /LENGTH=51 /DNA_ID=CAMNT_0012689847 /DNA_START=48 /DNA_END=199 /DNA_ORIENTATION=+